MEKSNLFLLYGSLINNQHQSQCTTTSLDFTPWWQGVRNRMPGSLGIIYYIGAHISWVPTDRCTGRPNFKATWAFGRNFVTLYYIFFLSLSQKVYNIRSTLNKMTVYVQFRLPNVGPTGYRPKSM